MKISSASKKVLASALSAAMVVAFAPTVAFGAQTGNKITVNYDLAGGTDAKADTQYAVKSGELTVETIPATYYAAGEKMLAKAGGTYHEFANTTFDNTQDKITASYKLWFEIATSGSATTVTVKWKKDDNTGDTYTATLPAGKYKVDNTGASPRYFVTDADLKAAAGWGENATWNSSTVYAPCGENEAIKTAAVADQLKFAAGTNLTLASGDDPATEAIEGYAFDHWQLIYDKDGDGVIESADGDFDDVTTTGGYTDVNPSKFFNGQTITAKAVYKNQVLNAPTVTFNQADGKVTVEATATTDSGKSIRGNAKTVVTAPDGTTSKSGDEVAAQVGTWTVTLTDGNGVTLDTKKVYIGCLTLTGGAYKAWGWNNSIASTQRWTTTQNLWYKAPASDSSYETIINGEACAVAYNIKSDGSVAYDSTALSDPTKTIKASAYYDAAGKGLDATATVKAGEKGAVATTLTALFGDEGKIAVFTGKKGTLTAIAAANDWLTSSEAGAVTKPETTTAGGFYLAITDAEGKIVAESVDSDNDSTNNGTFAGGTLTVTAKAGSYTATLYKVSPKTDPSGIIDGTPGKIEVVETKTVDMAEWQAAAPTWTYTAKYKTDGTVDGGSLVLANNAGEGFKVKYVKGSDTPSIEYDMSKGGIEVAKQDSQIYYTVVATNGKTGSDLVTSKTIKLIGYYNAKNAFDNAAAAFPTLSVNGKVGSYYATSDAVKAAVKAADKTFTDAGLVESKVVAGSETAWNATTIAAEQSVVDAVVSVAKAELDKYAAGVADAKGNVTVLTVDDYATALAAIEKISKDYALNHDADKTNNVAKFTKADGSKGDYAALSTYATAANEALMAGVAKAKVYKQVDVDAVAAVVEQLKSADAAAAKAGLAAYAALTDAQKALISATDVVAAQAVVKAAAEAEAAAQLVKEQDLAAVKYVNNPKTKTVKLATAKKGTASITYKSKVSASGNAVTYAKVSGAKIKVAASGKVTLKKVTKKGTYTGKVKVTCGDATRTVKVKFFVK